MDSFKITLLNEIQKEVLYYGLALKLDSSLSWMISYDYLCYETIGLVRFEDDTLVIDCAQSNKVVCYQLADPDFMIKVITMLVFNMMSFRYTTIRNKNGNTS